MTAVLLLAFAAAAAIIGPRLLIGAAWVRRAPAWGIIAWQALTISIVAALLLAGITLAVPLAPLADLIARVSGTAPTAVMEHYQTPAGNSIAWAATIVVAGLMMRMPWFAIVTITGDSRSRRGHRRLLRVAGRRHPDGFMILESSALLVYCVPGFWKRILVTAGALELLIPHAGDGTRP